MADAASSKNGGGADTNNGIQSPRSSALSSSPRGRANDRNGKGATKEDASKKRVSDDRDDDASDARDDLDGDETNSDSEHGASAVKSPPTTRRLPPKQAYRSDDGSETSSQDATDDEMVGGRGRRGETAASAVGHGTSSGDAPRERNSSMTLPSLSRAAMMHLERSREAERSGGSAKRGGDESAPSGMYSSGGGRGGGRRGGRAGAGGRSGGAEEGAWRRERSRSRSRDRAESNDRRWNENHQSKSSGRGDEEASRGQREEPPASPGGQDVRIMFHGREIYADDLIGLRVAKTFVGHGRFLGQVVKFDEPTSLYTIVYADGDAEELSIENTIQILIQDEIERADSSVPPVASSFRSERTPDSPEAGSVAPAPLANLLVAPLHGTTPPGVQPPHQAPAPAPYPPRRSAAMAISEREAQFVIGLFESHALPVLLRQGWRVQSNASRTEQRFVAPPGNFRGAGSVFPSALDVVELIAFDNELLTLCFPPNVHSAILSLFPEASGQASRKRGTPATAADGPDSYDSKRVRGGPHDGYAPSTGGPSVIMRASGAPVGAMPSRGADERLVPPVSYRADDRDRGERDPYGGPQNMSAPPERFPSGGPTRGEPVDGYRRAPSDYRSAPMRPGPPETVPSGSATPRWSGSQPGGPAEGADYHHRRVYNDAQDWHQREPMGGRGGPPPPAGYMADARVSPVGHRGEPYYGGDRVAPRGAPHAAVRSGGPSSGLPGPSDPPGAYGHYRDNRGPSPGSATGPYSPGPESYSNRYPPSRGDPQVADHRGPPGSSSSGGPPTAAIGDRFRGRPSGRSSGGPGSMLPPGPQGASRGFSMMDVDRNVSGNGAGGAYDRHRGRGDPASGSMPPHYRHHQRTASNGSLPNPADESRP